MVYKENIIEALRELSHETIQRQRWLSPSGPEVSSFTEAVTQLFDDTGLGDALDKQALVFNGPIDRKLKLLSTLLKGVDFSLPPGDLLANPKMFDIRTLAGTILSDIARLTKP